MTVSLTQSRPQVFLGVDTHKDFHVAATIDPLTGCSASKSFPTTRKGYEDLLKWANAQGSVVLCGCEGTASYGAGLTRFLQSANIAVVEVNRPDLHTRRRKGKSDDVDALSAARFAMTSRNDAPLPKDSTGAVEALRQVRLTRAGALKARKAAYQEMKALVIVAEQSLREQLIVLNEQKLIATCRGFRMRKPSTCRTEDFTKKALNSLARRITDLDAEMKDLDMHIDELVRATAPGLLDHFGVGIHTAAALIIAAGENIERLASRNAFLALCGVSPIDASSGKHQTHRLNRGGDRRANSALYSICMTRLVHDERTRTFYNKKIAEGKTKRGAIRCIKLYIAREIYKELCACLLNKHHAESSQKSLDKL